MKYMNKSITELRDLLDSNKVTQTDLINESLEVSHDIQEKCNAFVTILDDAKEKEKNDNILNNIPYGIKSNYSTKGILTTGSSNTLKDYVPYFNATVIEKLNECGAVPTNMTVMDEFGMGGTGMTGNTGVVTNPWDHTRMTAGSSAGSAAAVASGCYPFALGSDTGDSIRKPAAYCGIVGYKPTYGMISRYGLFPFASSLDHCGVLTRNVKDAALVVNKIKGIDEKDMTSWDSSDIDLTSKLNESLKGKKLAYIKEICDIYNYSDASDELKQHLANFKDKVELIKDAGAQIDEVSVDYNLLKAIFSTYQVISCAEATSNMSNLTGIIFGPRGDESKYRNIYDLMKDHRTNGFCSLIKRRFIIGSYVLQKENQERYYRNACRARRLIVDAWKNIFKDYDAVILPVGLGAAKKLDDNTKLDANYQVLDEHLQVGNFGGFPSITIPDGFINGLPVALNITGNCYKDEDVLGIASAIENLMDYKDQIAKEVI